MFCVSQKGNEAAATLGTFLATNSTITHLDLSNNSGIKDEGGAALAAGLATNTGVIELNLMGLGGGIAVRSEVGITPGGVLVVGG